jgi:hypothetical protein
MFSAVFKKHNNKNVNKQFKNFSTLSTLQGALRYLITCINTRVSFIYVFP